MIKKIIAYSFILIAGVIILAHDLVPHHHHDTDAVEQSQTNTSHSDKDHHRHFPEHQHQNGDYLLIVRPLITVSLNTINLFEENNSSDNNVPDYFFIHTPIFLHVYSPPDYKIPIWEKHQLFQTTVAFTFWLRAPPTV